MDEDTLNYREELLRTVEALARRWYPSGVSRELFLNALADALAATSSSEHENRGDVDGGSTQQVPLRAVFVVPAPLDSDDEGFLKRAVTQGLRWNWDEIAVVVNGSLNRVMPMVPIVRCGVDELLDAPDSKRVESADIDEARALHTTGISTVSISDARSSPQAKRQLWSDLQRLL